MAALWICVVVTGLTALLFALLSSLFIGDGHAGDAVGCALIAAALLALCGWGFLEGREINADLKAASEVTKEAGR